MTSFFIKIIFGEIFLFLLKFYIYHNLYVLSVMLFSYVMISNLPTSDHFAKELSSQFRRVLW